MKFFILSIVLIISCNSVQAITVYDMDSFTDDNTINTRIDNPDGTVTVLNPRALINAEILHFYARRGYKTLGVCEYFQLGNYVGEKKMQATEPTRCVALYPNGRLKSIITCPSESTYYKLLTEIQCYKLDSP